MSETVTYPYYRYRDMMTQPDQDRGVMSGNLYLKWTRKGRIPTYQGGDPIPYRRWTPSVEWPVLCRRGWHACRWEDVPDHVSDELWVCEMRGKIVQGNDKVAASSLRLVRKVSIGDRELRLFAADCAERVLPIFERRYPNDPRPREAIRVARLYAEGQATGDELVTAEDAAWTAAWNPAKPARAARAAAGDAARAASAAASAAASVARTAAWDAAWTARTAVRAAERAAERTWQTDRLLAHYVGLDPADFAHRGEQ